MSVKIQLILTPEGQIDVKSTSQDAAMVVLMLEKAKLRVVEGCMIKSEESRIFKPGSLN